MAFAGPFHPTAVEGIDTRRSSNPRVGGSNPPRREAENLALRGFLLSGPESRLSASVRQRAPIRERVAHLWRKKSLAPLHPLALLLSFGFCGNCEVAQPREALRATRHVTVEVVAETPYPRPRRGSRATGMPYGATPGNRLRRARRDLRAGGDRRSQRRGDAHLHEVRTTQRQANRWLDRLTAHERA